MMMSLRSSDCVQPLRASAGGLPVSRLIKFMKTRIMIIMIHRHHPSHDHPSHDDARSRPA
eukprot:2057245-Rhodomonas_salina.1